MNPRRGKPVIEQLIFSPEERQKINQILAAKLTRQSKHINLRALTGGSCVVCRTDFPTKKVTFRTIEGAKLVEFYCDKCFPTDIRNLK